MKRRRWWVVAAALAVVSFAAVDGPQAAGDTAGSVPSGAFTLVDHHGRTVTDKDFRGKFLLIFFGYTHCIDVCPTTLLQISTVMERLSHTAGDVQPLFITVDPERDTPESLAEYLGAFDESITGLSGTPEETRKVATAYMVHYAKKPYGSAPEQGDEHHHSHGEDADLYSVEHSPFIYFMGPAGEYITHFAPGASPDVMAHTIRESIERRTRSLTATHH